MVVAHTLYFSQKYYILTPQNRIILKIVYLTNHQMVGMKTCTLAPIQCSTYGRAREFELCAVRTTTSAKPASVN
jgi:hypothetical protein